MRNRDTQRCPYVETPRGLKSAARYKKHSCILTKVSICILLASSVLAAGGCAASSSGSSGRTPWAIRCLEAPDARSAHVVDQLADVLRRSPGIRPGDVLVHTNQDGIATLYYGRYYRVRDAKTGKQHISANMRQDLTLLREFVDQSQRRYFVRALPVRYPTPDVGNPAWVLANVDAKYSLQVAAFEPTETFWQFKQAAADSCKVLRDAGHEAYFHHTDSGSVVTVGAFGADAVRRGADGLTYYSAEVRKLQQNEMLRYNLVNGSIHRVRVPGSDPVRVPSRLVEIPKPGGS